MKKIQRMMISQLRKIRWRSRHCMCEKHPVSTPAMFMPENLSNNSLAEMCKIVFEFETKRLRASFSWVH